MTNTDQLPGPYTLSFLAREAAAQGPRAVRGLPEFLGGFVGEGRVEPATRVAFFLRMSKLLGCPVCRALFPKLAPMAGIDAAAAERAIHGEAAGLPAEAAAALAWAEAVMEAGGDEPAQVPTAAAALSDAQRAHLLQAIRIERVVHATGLLFLPRAMVERAATH
ncbi:MAG: hypothetical protein AMXMBFR64_02320 [Myxococcales bacterium]